MSTAFTRSHSDGAEVERAAQQMIADKAESCFVYAIPNSKPGCTVTLEIPKYYGQHPTIITQDPKHALKTARNQIMMVKFKSTKDEDMFEACELALAAEALDKSQGIEALPDSTEESLAEIRSEIRAHLNTIPLPKLRPVAPDSFDRMLTLVVDGKLNGPLLAEQRLLHQTKSTAKAVQQHGRASAKMFARDNEKPETDSGPSLRETLLKRLVAAVPASDAFNKTTGIDRYVRHAGTFSGPEPPAGTKRAENKKTVQAAAASKFVHLRATGLSQFQSIHPNVYSANISDLNPLKDGHFVLAMKPGASTHPEIIVGEVLTMYSKNTNHDWIAQTTSVGTPLYIYVQVYRLVGGDLFTSMACQSLGTSSFLQIPRTHLLFSLASFSKIQRQDVASKDPVTLVTLCADSLALYQAFHRARSALQVSIQELSKSAKSKKVEDVAHVSGDSAESSSDSGDEAGA
ncbi:hypothetical protein DFH07DRAFT_785479 [Mycena maculata]|uniref:Uncharacterized protein n=1 Tax=Mycena maculata TaxID=230809 RepID=A0AAD7MGP1_9AGAR|nr:hypothetical protein DFH07DRAFT_785479 [Mycena maculata]